jgi:hypothetical protein
MAAEIQQGMFEVLTGSESGRVAYYHMSDGTGTLISDDSLNNWTGTLLDGVNGAPPNGAPALWVTSDAFGGP